MPSLNAFAWFGFSLFLFGLELILPQKFRLCALGPGLVALIVALFSWRYARFEDLHFQIAYWVGLSTIGLIWIRPLLLQYWHRDRLKNIEAIEAISITNITPHAPGRVLYEGTSWPARSTPGMEEIEPNQTVYILRREGNTLIVAPRIE